MNYSNYRANLAVDKLMLTVSINSNFCRRFRDAFGGY